ncbi:hypothetical protein F4677DRAFT_440864 [Hypoxylon crocopeplum]|nr:hypothetical protein F4677DRAFT_440864 [Hypoxylon crocopeplum]
MPRTFRARQFTGQAFMLRLVPLPSLLPEPRVVRICKAYASSQENPPSQAKKGMMTAPRRLRAVYIVLRSVAAGVGIGVGVGVGVVALQGSIDFYETSAM